MKHRNWNAICYIFKSPEGDPLEIDEGFYAQSSS